MLKPVICRSAVFDRSGQQIHIIITIIIKNVLIIVTLHTKVLQGHFTQINAKTLQNNHTIARTVTSLEAAGRSEKTVHLGHWLVSCSMHVMPPP